MLLLDFLMGRTLQILVNGQMSTTKVSNTRSLQGCVLSPLLFLLCRQTAAGLLKRAAILLNCLMILDVKIVDTYTTPIRCKQSGLLKQVNKELT